MERLLSAIECPRCLLSDGLRLSKQADQRRGFAERLSLSCAHCSEVLSEGFSSPQLQRSSPGPNPFYVNDALMVFFKEAKLGHKAMEQLGAILGINVMHLKTYQEKKSVMDSVYVERTEEVLRQAADIVRVLHDATDGRLLDITVTYDGSWLTRGYKSLLGFAAVIDITTGFVLDYVVHSKYCHSCACKAAKLEAKGGKDSDDFKTWFDSHEPECCVDYVGSSGGMEVQGAADLFSRSIEKHNFR